MTTDTTDITDTNEIGDASEDHPTEVELTFEDFYVLTADDVDAFAVNWNEKPEPPPYYVTVDGKRFALAGQTYLVRGYGAELPDWVRAEDEAGHLVLFVERAGRLLAYSYDPTVEAEEEEASEGEAAAE